MPNERVQQRELCQLRAEKQLSLESTAAAAAAAAAMQDCFKVKGAKQVAICTLLRVALYGAAMVSIERRHQKRLEKCDDVSPLVLDLDGDGVEAGGITHFDHGGDGWSELTRWAGADDGVLVWDSNNDGVINDGSELFGNNSVLGNGRKAAHGFAALADFDSNGDGKVDSRDSGRDTNNDGVVDGKDKNWENLRVMRWTDANNNGIKESGEESMVTLASLNIRSLGTGFNTFPRLTCPQVCQIFNTLN